MFAEKENFLLPTVLFLPQQGNSHASVSFSQASFSVYFSALLNLTTLIS
jgi:hypothetical protein